MTTTAKYLEKNKKVGVFGIKYLDDKLFGILNTDLILIGARSGAGKSTVSSIIAQANANKGNKVVLFSLENFENDDYVTSVFYEYKKRANKPYWKLRGFVSGAYELDYDLIKEIEKDVDEKYKNIKRISRQMDYDLDKLKEDIIKYALEGYKLFIIDHLDYVENKDQISENIFLSDLMKMIREAQETFNIAIVAISHLRKNVTKFVPKVPSMDEFMGSSNKVKQSTLVIMFAPNEEENLKHLADSDFCYRYTFCCIRKCRNGGIDNKVANLKFNIKTGQYEEDKKVTEYGVSFDGLTIQ